MADLQPIKRPNRIKDLAGQIFGDWTVIEFAGTNSYKKLLWRCRCKCGKEKLVTSNNLTRGKTTNCGCGKGRWRIIDMSGQIYGRLTVIRYVGMRKHNALWECQCSCGQIVTLPSSNLRNGNTKSCGCLNLESIIERSTIHGLSHTKEYRAWTNMKQRCLNPARPDYSDYGERGITIVPEWIDSFEAFFNDVGPCPDDGWSIDRIDNNKGYSKDNVRWTTATKQANNRRRRRPRIKL